MKAIVYKEYGSPDVLRLVDVKKPAPANDEVLVEVLASSAHRSIFDYKRALTAKGIYVMAGGCGAEVLQAMLLGPLLSISGKNKMGIVMAKQDKKNLIFLRDLLESGKLVPVSERTYPLGEAADALRYLEQNHAKGKVVVMIEH